MESSTQTIKTIFLIFAATLLINLLIWLPHLLNLSSFLSLDYSSGFNTIFRNYDGIEYIVIAKSFYNPELIASLPQSLPANYYASHFPFYSVLILIFAPLLGFLKSMIFISTLFTALSAIAFYFLVRDFKLSPSPLTLSLIFLILPARWVIVHSVGSSEPVFIFFIITAFYFFLKYEAINKWLYIYLAGLLGMAAQITRPPGILLFISLSLYILWSLKGRTLDQAIRTVFPYYPLIFIPLGLLGIFYWFGISYNDFFAFFHSGDNIHLTFPPYQVFNINQYWVGEAWLEDIVLILLLGFFGGILLLKQNLLPLGFFVLTYFLASSLVVHRDISRYILPAFPFLLIAFQKVLISKEFKIALIILTLGIYLYSQNYIINNTAPIPNLEEFDVF